jgi:hypothetical protein
MKERHPENHDRVLNPSQQKHRRALCRCFFIGVHHRSVEVALFTLSSLMPRAGQQLTVLMLAHLFSAFLDYAAQQITPIHNKVFG